MFSCLSVVGEQDAISEKASEGLAGFFSRPKRARKATTMIFFAGVAVTSMNLVGKTREQIRAALASKTREELLDMICSLATVEQLYKPAQIASLSCVNKRAVLRDLRDGKFGEYYCRAENSVAIPSSGVNAWRRRFLVPVKGNGADAQA